MRAERVLRESSVTGRAQKDKHMDLDAKERLNKAAHAINTAAVLLKMEMPIFEEFLEECRRMDSFGPIIDPTLFQDPERRAVAAILGPLFQQAATFVRVYDTQMERAKSALSQVTAQDTPHALRSHEPN